MNMKKVLVTASFCGAVISNIAFANTDAVDMGKYVVTSTKEKVSAIDIPASVTIMTAEDIAKSGYRSTPEIIGNLPGIIDQSQGDSYSFDFRGTKSSDSHGPHILIDGREVNLGIFGFNIIGSIPLEIIDRIEVIRTPGAYISGRDSSRGVINIITKTGEQSESVFKPEVQFSYGSWDTSAESLSLSGSAKKMNYFLNISYKESDGYRNTQPMNRSILGSYDYYLTDTLRLGFDVQYNKEERKYTQGLAKWQLDGGYRRESSIPSAQTGGYIKNPNTITNEVLGGTLSLDYNAEPYRAGFSFNLSDYEDHYEMHTYDNRASSKKYNYEKDRTQNIYEFKLFGERRFYINADLKDSIEAGYDYSYRPGDQVTLYPFDSAASARTKEDKGTIDYEEKYHAVFLNNELDYDKFALGTGLRYEFSDYEMTSKEPKEFENDFKKLGWNFAPSYEMLPKGNVYFNVARSYFYPTGSYFYYAMDKDSADNRVEDLKPEETTSYEIGFKHDYAVGLNYSINLFYMDVGDRFLSFYDDAGSWKGWKNVGDSTNQGVELAIEGRPLSWFGYDFIFSYLDAEWDSGTMNIYEYGATPAADVKKNMDVSGKKVSDVPEIQYRFGLQFLPRIEGLKMNLGLSYIGEKYIDPWNRYKSDDVYLVDAKITYEKENWSLYVSGENIFDTEYEKIYNSDSERDSNGDPVNSYYPKNGMYIEAGVSLRF